MGNISGDAAFASCNDDEVVVGGGGTCSIFYNGEASTAISSLPVMKGVAFPGWGTGAGVAGSNGWYYDCNGHPGIGGIATAVAACLKP